MIVRQLFDADTWTYTYLVADQHSHEALLIDPVLSQVERDLKLINELGLTLKYALDTHVHADHITANGTLRDRTGCQTGIAAANQVACADHGLECGDELSLGNHMIKVLCTPGHTDGCISFLIGNHVFTGDSLFIRGCGRTDFQQGDAGKLYDSITQTLFTLPDETWVHPGHDYHGHTISTIGEEKRFNPRLTLSRDEFIAYMENLDLPDPKYMMEAVPANQTCGKAA
ncbi:MAG: MBL fold metallo-hydrolase [Gammaproteobacteria bacterium]|nr:MAG: MBL fold metallo-hydrolase [Gammaproteobacteria bacterium]